MTTEPRNELERAMMRTVWRLIGAERWPTGRRITSQERRWLAGFLLVAFHPQP